MGSRFKIECSQGFFLNAPWMSRLMAVETLSLSIFSNYFWDLSVLIGVEVAFRFLRATSNLKFYSFSLSIMNSCSPLASSFWSTLPCKFFIIPSNFHISSVFL